MRSFQRPDESVKRAHLYFMVRFRKDGFSHHEADDLAQEAMLRIARFLARLGTPSAYERVGNGLLGRIYRCTRVDGLRSKNGRRGTKRYREVSFTDCTKRNRLASSDAMPWELGQRDCELNELLELVETYGDETIYAVVEAVLSGYSQNEAAEIIGVSLRSVQRCMREARAILKRLRRRDD